MNANFSTFLSFNLNLFENSSINYRSFSNFTFNPEFFAFKSRHFVNDFFEFISTSVHILLFWNDESFFRFFFDREKFFWFFANPVQSSFITTFNDQFQNITINNSFNRESTDHLSLHNVWSPFVNIDMTENFDFFMIINSIAFTALLLFCSCDHHYDDNVINYFLCLSKMTTWWNHCFLFFDILIESVNPLHKPEMLSRSVVESIIELIQWKKLLMKFFHFNYANFDKRFRWTIIDQIFMIKRHWNVDNMIAYATTLVVHRQFFQFCYFPHFSRQITQNQRVMINDHEIHKCKHFQMNYNMNDREWNEKTYVFFFFMSRNFKDITHFNHTHQSIWINVIIRSALKANCSDHVHSQHVKIFQNAWYKANVWQKINHGNHNYFDLEFVVFVDSLELFWIEMIQLTNTFSDFRNSILALIVYDLKLITTFDDFLMAQNRFMSDLYNWFDMFIEIVFSDQCYVDFGMNDWSQAFNTSEFILLWKIACLHYWIFRFADDNNNHCLKLQKIIFSFFSIQNVASVSILLTHINLIWI